MESPSYCECVKQRQIEALFEVKRGLELTNACYFISKSYFFILRDIETEFGISSLTIRLRKRANHFVALEIRTWKPLIRERIKQPYMQRRVQFRDFKPK